MTSQIASVFSVTFSNLLMLLYFLGRLGTFSDGWYSPGMWLVAWPIPAEPGVFPCFDWLESFPVLLYRSSSLEPVLNPVPLPQNVQRHSCLAPLSVMKQYSYSSPLK